MPATTSALESCNVGPHLHLHPPKQHWNIADGGSTPISISTPTSRPASGSICISISPNAALELRNVGLHIYHHPRPHPPSPSPPLPPSLHAHTSICIPIPVSCDLHLHLNLHPLGVVAREGARVLSRPRAPLQRGGHGQTAYVSGLNLAEADGYDHRLKAPLSANQGG